MCTVQESSAAMQYVVLARRITTDFCAAARSCEHDMSCASPAKMLQGKVA